MLKVAIALSYLKKRKDSIQLFETLVSETSEGYPVVLKELVRCNLGVALFKKRVYKTAKDIFEQILVTFENKNITKESIFPLKYLALTLDMLNEEDKAHEMFKRLSFIVFGEPDFFQDIFKAENQLNQGNLYLKHKKMVSAQTYLFRSRETISKYDFPTLKAKIHQSLASYYIAKGNSVAANRSLDEVNELKHYLDESIDIDALYLLVGIRAAESGDYTKAKPILEEKLPSVLETNNEETIAEVKSKLAHAYLYLRELPKHAKFQKEVLSFYKSEKKVSIIEEIHKKT